jgi:hypothetical protein
MEQGLTPIELRDIDAGIQSKSSDLAIEGEFQRFPLTTGTKNWSFGKRKGLTTRYGIMPFPGHNSSDNSGESQMMSTGALAGIKPVNLVGAESALPISPEYNYDSFRNNYNYYDKRNSVLGVTFFSQPVQPATNTTEYPVLYWMTTRTRTTTNQTKYQFDLVPSTVWGGSYSGKQEIVSQYEATVGGGTAVIPFNTNTTGTETPVNSLFESCVNVLTNDIFSLRAFDNKQWFLNSTEHVYNFQYKLNDFIVKCDSGSPVSKTRPVDGYFSSFGKPFFNENPNQITVETVDSLTSKLIWAAPATMKNRYERKGDVHYTTTFSRTYDVFTSATITAGGVVYFNTENIVWSLIKDNTTNDYGTMFCSVSEYTKSVGVRLNAIVHNGRAIIASKHEQIADKLENTTVFTGNTILNFSNDYIAWSDVTKNIFQIEFSTKALGTLVPTYLENGISKSTCWYRANEFSSSTKTDCVIADKGVLEAGKEYEYAYSILNKITGVETNVGKPAKAFTGTAALSAIRVAVTKGYRDGSVYTDVFCFPSQYDISKQICSVISIQYPKDFPFNLFAYRLYYREVGSFEWLFSGEYSFAFIYFDTNQRDIYIGAADAVGLPGGQPGGYVDNSPLPSDQYIDVKSFAGKLWWVSKDAVRFSSANAFVYPVRNFIAASSGEFKGAVVHYFAGQAEARGRLVVFGSKGMYDIRQTTEFQYTQIQVSASSQPLSVPIPDSNFQVAERSSHTAFSGRCATVAENALYFWGPSGIFRDDGVNLPVRISDAIEPDLFDSYDKTKTDEFFAYYNKKSQEILFFFRPSDTTAGDLTLAWVYSMRTEDFPNGIVGAWTRYTYSVLIDWAQEIDLTKFIGGKVGGTLETPRAAGLRTVIGVRANAAATVSRPYFHDEFCDCGDMTPGTEMMVKSVSRVDATTVRLTFASDHNASILSGVSVGGSVYIFGSKEYGKLSVSLDGLREVKAKGSGTLDILDSSAYVGPDTLSMRSYFPVFFSNHDIPCVIATNFFAPYGVTKWSRFRYSHLLTQPTPAYSGTVAPTATVTWNCNHTLSTSTSKTIALNALNARERTTQVIFDMQSPGMQSEGQGIELGVSYNQRGPRWTLFAWTLWTAPLQGSRNLLTYQQ